MGFVLDELARLVDRHARPDLTSAVDGLLVSRVDTAPPEYSLTEPLLVVLARGGKRLLLGDRTFEYGAGQCLVVTAALPVTGHYTALPTLGIGLRLRPPDIAALLLRGAPSPPETAPAMATGPVPPELLDAVVRLVRLLDCPADAPVLGPLIQQEILWRLLTGPHAATVRRIGLAGGAAAHVGRAIAWIHANYAEPLVVADLARLAGLSPSALHRHFRAVTAMSPLQFQKRIRLQEARARLATDPGDVAGAGHLVGYDSPSQFSREYRRLFGAPPGADAARLRSEPVLGLP